MDFMVSYSFAKPFVDLFLNNCRELEDTIVDISPIDFKDGYGLFTFNLTPDMDSCCDHVSAPEIGVVNFRAEFSQASDKPFVILIIHEHERVIDIDRERNVRVE